MSFDIKDIRKYVYCICCQWHTAIHAIEANNKRFSASVTNTAIDKILSMQQMAEFCDVGESHLESVMLGEAMRRPR